MAADVLLQWMVLAHSALLQLLAAQLVPPASSASPPSTMSLAGSAAGCPGTIALHDAMFSAASCSEVADLLSGISLELDSDFFENDVDEAAAPACTPPTACSTRASSCAST